MKPYEQMDDDERLEFIAMVQGILNEIGSATESQRRIRPALILLWAMAHGRATLNLSLHYEVDPSGFVDEAIRKGTHLMENLLKVMHRHPPPALKTSGAELLQQGRRIIDVMQAPAYRPTVIAVVEDFFRDAREEGQL